MALTQISTGGIKDDAVTDAKLPANSVGNSEMKDDAVDSAEIADGAVDLVHLSASGTASSSTFLRGDNTWATPPDTDTNTQLSTEQVQDIVGAMFTGNTETNITATYEDGDGTIDLVASAGVGGATGVTFNDSVAANFGTDGDQAIWHTGTVGYIRNSTGGFCIRNDNFSVKDDAESEIMLTAVKDGSVDLYHNNHKSFQTHGEGIRVNGPEGSAGDIHLYADEGDDNADKWKISADTSGNLSINNYTSGSWETNFKTTGNGSVEIYHDNVLKFATLSNGAELSGHLHMADDQEVRLGNVGAGGDLKIYHDGTDSRIKDVRDSGTLRLQADSIGFNDKDVSETMLLATADGSVDLYYNGTKKLETTDTGASVSGALNAAGATFGDYNVETNRTSGSSKGFYVKRGGTTVGILANHGTGPEGKLELYNSSTLNLHANGTAGTIALNGYIRFGVTNGSESELDDYEEGTWTPDLGNFSALSFNSRSGRFIKIGKLVYASCHMNIASRTGNASPMLLTGLPFTGVNENPAGAGTFGYSAGVTSDTYDVPTILIGKNETQAYFYKSSGSNFNANELNMSSGSLYIMLVYEST